MTLEIIIRDSNGEELVNEVYDATKPAQWRCPVDKPLVETELREGGGKVVYSLHGWVWHPQLTRQLWPGGAQ